MLTTAKLQVRQVQGGFETLIGRPAYRSGSMMAKVSWLVEGRATESYLLFIKPNHAPTPVKQVTIAVPKPFKVL